MPANNNDAHGGTGPAASAALDGTSPAESAAPVLRTEGLRVTYASQGSPVHAVRGIDLAVAPGELVGLVGESGCGKSTIAMAALGLLRPDVATVSGSVIVAGRQIVGASGKELRAIRWNRVSLVPQSAMNALSPVLTIGEQIVDAVRAHERMPKRQALDLTVDALERVGLTSSHARAYPHELSGGMRQRAVIAMATVLRPELLIMDEPTTALDVVTQQLVLDQVSELSRELGFAVVLITHDLPMLLEWAHRIIVMYAGSVVETGTPHDISREPYHPYTDMLLRSFPPLSGERRELAVIPGQPWDLRRVADQCLFADRCEHVTDPCGRGTPRLTTHAGRSVACFLRDPPPPAARAADTEVTQGRKSK